MNGNPLGEQTRYPGEYDPGVLFSIPRRDARSILQLDAAMPMHGFDHWHAYELSWLNKRGKPQVAIGEFFFPADSENIVESKSFKLYLNSLNQCKFSDRSGLLEVLEKDLSAVCGSTVEISLKDANSTGEAIKARQGKGLDDLDVAVDVYRPEPALLKVSRESIVDAELYSDLFRSNCPVTGQPDWASIVIRYSGSRLDEPSLLQYLCSFREHRGYHEECCERIYRDLFRATLPKNLFVAMNFLRRGGLDINVYRSSKPVRSDQILPRRPRQ